MARIFLCHANEDKPQVEALYNRLRDFGFEPWMDKKDLIPGQNWEREIPRALKSAALVLICLSQNIGRRGYVQREFKLAVDALQEIPEEMIHTIPVRFEPCNVPEQFAALHWCDLFEADGFDRLRLAIRYGFEQRGLPVPDGLIPSPTTSDASRSTADPLSPFTNSINMEFILIPAGEFMMGTPRHQLDAIAGDNEDYRLWIENETPQHRVVISEPFYMGKYPVTQAEWQAIMGDNPSRFKGDTRPVENVSWDDVQAFIRKLNEHEGVRHYRLPTEAQWEYACRARSTTLWHFGDNKAQLVEYAWYDENSDDETHPVGQKKPNAWGLYDMHGNVFEWCQDWFDKVYYRKSPDTHPHAPDAGADRALRGGSWAHPEQIARAAHRHAVDPRGRAVNFGFRCLSSGREPRSGA